jgi:hypothetical protein
MPRSIGLSARHPSTSRTWLVGTPSRVARLRARYSIRLRGAILIFGRVARGLLAPLTVAVIFPNGTVGGFAPATENRPAGFACPHVRHVSLPSIGWCFARLIVPLGRSLFRLPDPAVASACRRSPDPTAARAALVACAVVGSHRQSRRLTHATTTGANMIEPIVGIASTIQTHCGIVGAYRREFSTGLGMIRSAACPVRGTRRHIMRGLHARGLLWNGLATKGVETCLLISTHAIPRVLRLDDSRR